MTKKIRLLIIDDSLLIRKMIRSIVSADPFIDVVGEAEDPIEAREKIKSLNPDVVTLDVEMPKMDGLSFLTKIMSLRPMPVIMVSTLTQRGADVTIRALEIGAVDYVAKPAHHDLTMVSQELISKIKIASIAKVTPYGRKDVSNLANNIINSPAAYTKNIIAIGSSTGGVESLFDILVRLPADCPPVVIAQHISNGFSKRFALRVDKSCAVHVKEAEDKERLMPGTVYIGPGGKHLMIKKAGNNIIGQVIEDTLGENYRPSVDRLFCSVANTVQENAVGVILTGMGKDGARGLLEMRNAGATTLGQDESSSIVYGMPKAAMMAGAVQKQVSLSNMAENIISACATRRLRKKVGNL